MMRYVQTRIRDHRGDLMGYMEFPDGSYAVWPPDVVAEVNTKTGIRFGLRASVIGGGAAENFVRYHVNRIQRDVGRFQA